MNKGCIMNKKLRTNKYKYGIISALLFFACSVMSLFSQGQDFFLWYWDVGTAAVAYGDEKVIEENELVRNLDGRRFILSGELGVGIELDERIRLLSGGIIVSDFLLGSDSHANRLDYGLFTGVRVYPNLAGFNVGVDYVLGARTNFVQVPGDTDSRSTTTPWGNGFRLNAGYDFSYQGSRFAPNVEGSYRLMPRGGTYDHCFSLSLNFTIFP